MADDPSLSLLDDFPAPTFEAWREKLESDLKGRSPASLTWVTEDGTELPPVPGAAPPGETFDLVPPRSCARVVETDPPGIGDGRAALEAGWDLLRVVIVPTESSDPGEIDFPQVLADLPDDVLIDAENPLTVQHALAYCAAGEGRHRVAPVFDDYGCEFYSWAGSAAQELAVVVAHGIWMLRGAPNPSEFSDVASPVTGISPAVAAKSLALTFFVGTHVLEDVAKLRAARRVWSRVTGAFGIKGQAARAFICAESHRDAVAALDAHTNLIRTTLHGFAAAVGGADVICLAPFHRPGPLFEGDGGSRLALNQHRLLMEESFLGRVADPTAGSHAIEVLTDAVARRAWELVQRIEAAGGFADASREGGLYELLGIDETAEQRLTDAATRTRITVGISGFAAPPVEPHEPEDLPSPPEDLFDDEESDDFGDEDFEGEAGDFVPRCAEPFERLHLTANHDAARRGRRARVLLLPLGVDRVTRGRADFAADFFRSGGFDVLDPHHLAGVPEAVEAARKSEVDLTVLCAADADVVDLAQELAASDLGRPVYIAGRPTDPSLGAVVADFVFQGVDAVEILDRAQELAGMGEPS